MSAELVTDYLPTDEHEYQTESVLGTCKAMDHFSKCEVQRVGRPTRAALRTRTLVAGQTIEAAAPLPGSPMVDHYARKSGSRFVGLESSG